MLLALLPFCMPFFLGHARTAMLDLPMLAFTLLAVLALAYRGGWIGAMAAGLFAGAAVMTKGPAGSLALLTAVAACLLRRGYSVAIARDIVIAVLLAAVPILVYAAMLPQAYRDGYAHVLFGREIVKRLAGEHPDGIIKTALTPFAWNLGWYVPAAACGLVVALSKARDVEFRRWLLLGLIVGVPVIWITANEAVPYARYLLPVYPGMAVLAALFCLNAGAGRGANILLVVFIIASCLVDFSPLAMLVVGAAVMVPVAKHLENRGWVRALPVARGGLLAAVVIATFASPAAWRMILRDNRLYRPEAEILARQVPALVPEGGRLIIGGGFKVHNVLFHGQRGLETLEHWLKENYHAGELRTGIFARGEWTAFPTGDTRVVAREGDWVLAQIALSPEDAAALQFQLRDL
jgi:4-amino-4-deoxy-L-arabinose transferase-like glycosyltransferase